MKFSSIKKYQGLIITTVQTLAILFLALVTTILQCGFDFEEFNWLTFCLNFLFTTYMKAVYTGYSKNKEILSDNIVVLENTINHDRTEIYNAQKTEEFEKEVERRNKINKLEAYIKELDDTKRKDSNKKFLEEERNWAFDYKLALTKEQDVEPFERIKSLKSVKVDYEKIEASKLFTFGKNQMSRKRKYTFSSTWSSINRAAIPTVVSILLSILFGAIQNETYLQSGKVWIDLAGYVASISLGAAWGFSNGKAIIQEDYAEVLNNVASLIREIKAKILPTEGTVNEKIKG